MRFWVTITIVLVLAAMAQRHGRGPERSVSIILAGNLALAILNMSLRGPPQFDGIDPPVFVADFVTLIGLVWVAVNANRMWPLVVAALQLLVMIVHFSVLVSVGGRSVYWGMIALSEYVELLVLAIGIACHCVRERRHGPYRSWRNEVPAVHGLHHA